MLNTMNKSQLTFSVSVLMLVIGTVQLIHIQCLYMHIHKFIITSKFWIIITDLYFDETIHHGVSVCSNLIPAQYIHCKVCE